MGQNQVSVQRQSLTPPMIKKYIKLHSERIGYQSLMGDDLAREIVEAYIYTYSGPITERVWKRLGELVIKFDKKHQNLTSLF